MGAEIAARHRYRQDVLFRVAVLFKGLDGAVELIAALALLLLSRQEVYRLAADVVTHDLLGPPDGTLARRVVASTDAFATGDRTFVVAYLAVHGLIKLGLVVALLRRWRSGPARWSCRSSRRSTWR